MEKWRVQERGRGEGEEGEKGPGDEGKCRCDGIANTPAMADGKWRDGGCKGEDAEGAKRERRDRGVRG